MMKQRRLGVNIDHIATLREARGERYPDPVEALSVLKASGAHQVTLHLREDRRHIQDSDLQRIVHAGILPVNLEMAVTDEMVGIASRSKVTTCTFVPEKRLEVTTEGGLDAKGNLKRVERAVKKLQSHGKNVSLFIDPKRSQIRAAREAGADAVEFHTGHYCRLFEKYFAHEGSYRLRGKGSLTVRIRVELDHLGEMSCLAADGGLKVYAGHGLHVDNLKPVAKIPEIEEYNIGHAIVARAVFVGLEKAILEIHQILAKVSGEAQ